MRNPAIEKTAAILYRLIIDILERMFYNDGMHNRSGERKGIEMENLEILREEIANGIMQLSNEDCAEILRIIKGDKNE